MELRKYEWDTYGASFGIIDRYHVKEFDKVYAYHIFIYTTQEIQLFYIIK